MNRFADLRAREICSASENLRYQQVRPSFVSSLYLGSHMLRRMRPILLSLRVNFSAFFDKLKIVAATAGKLHLRLQIVNFQSADCGQI